MISICRTLNTNTNRIYNNSSIVRLIIITNQEQITTLGLEPHSKTKIKMPQNQKSRILREFNIKNAPELCHLPFSTISYNNYENHPLMNLDNTDPIIVKCGELRTTNVGQTVRISGRLHRKHIGRFAIIEDRTGITQLIIKDEFNKGLPHSRNIPNNIFAGTIIGTVTKRPLHAINLKLPTGEIEVQVEHIITNNCQKLFNKNKNKNNKRLFSTMVEKEATDVTKIENIMSKSENILKYFENRQYTLNNINMKMIGQEIELIGWLSSLPKHENIQLCDGYGMIQIQSDSVELQKIILNSPANTVVSVQGKVCEQSSNNNINLNQIKIKLNKLKILNPDEPYTGPIKTNNVQGVSDVSNKENTSPQIKYVNNLIKVITSKLNDSNRFTYRTHNCNELRHSNVGETVTLCGWVQFQRMKMFLILRDGYGSTQVIIPPTCATSNFDEINLETVVKVTGKVVARPKNTINSKLLTGDIEIIADKFEILNKAIKNLPFNIRGYNRAKEPLRLEYRYLDLRFNDMQQNLRTRSSVLMKIREYLINHLSFVEVETPTLFRRTPGGAQEFIVPTQKPGHFYSLVQSPQQFKQMLMAGAIDRYFQIARCYRDEATRPDRQPEFTQLDIELSFSSRGHIMKLIEETLLYCWPKEFDAIRSPFPIMTYEDAMSQYGTDKPNTSFDLTFTDVENILRTNDDIYAKYENFKAYAIVARKSTSYYSQAMRKSLNKIAEEYKNTKFIIYKCGDLLEIWSDGLLKLLSPSVCEKLKSKLQLESGDVILLAYGNKLETQKILGRIRLMYKDILEENHINFTKSSFKYNFVWIIDFPLFIRNEETNQIESTHHPFTAPNYDDYNKLTKNSDEIILQIRSQAYDLVLNGHEIGGGSIRIHNKMIQKYVLENILKISHTHLEHLLNALDSGCPPHGGIALGLDRLLSIMCNTNSIRDVIAFPKGLDGKDHLSKAPTPITDYEKKLYNIEIISSKKKDQ